MDVGFSHYEFDFDSVFDADDYLYFYRESLTDKRSDAEVDGIVKLAGLEKPMKILDLACGYGRHANRMIDRISFDPIAGRSNKKRIVILKGLRKDKPFSLRLYNPNEITDLLHESNYGSFHFYGSWEGEPVGIDSRRLIIVAEK